METGCLPRKTGCLQWKTGCLPPIFIEIQLFLFCIVFRVYFVLHVWTGKKLKFYKTHFVIRSFSVFELVNNWISMKTFIYNLNSGKWSNALFTVTWIQCVSDSDSPPAQFWHSLCARHLPPGLPSPALLGGHHRLPGLWHWCHGGLSYITRPGRRVK